MMWNKKAGMTGSTLLDLVILAVVVFLTVTLLYGPAQAGTSAAHCENQQTHLGMGTCDAEAYTLTSAGKFICKEPRYVPHPMKCKNKILGKKGKEAIRPCCIDQGEFGATGEREEQEELASEIGSGEEKIGEEDEEEEVDEIYDPEFEAYEAAIKQEDQERKDLQKALVEGGSPAEQGNRRITLGEYYIRLGIFEATEQLFQHAARNHPDPGQRNHALLRLAELYTYQSTGTNTVYDPVKGNEIYQQFLDQPSLDSATRTQIEQAMIPEEDITVFSPPQIIERLEGKVTHLRTILKNSPELLEDVENDYKIEIVLLSNRLSKLHEQHGDPQRSEEYALLASGITLLLPTEIGIEVKEHEIQERRS